MQAVMKSFLDVFQNNHCMDMVLVDNWITCHLDLMSDLGQPTAEANVGNVSSFQFPPSPCYEPHTRDIRVAAMILLEEDLMMRTICTSVISLIV